MSSSILFCVEGCHGAGVGLSLAKTLSVLTSTAKFFIGLIVLLTNLLTMSFQPILIV